MAEPQEPGRQMPLPFPTQTVTKSNALCRARWSADSILEPRIIAQVAARVNPDDSDSLTYDIPVSQLLKKNYTGKDLLDLRAATKKIISRVVEMNLTDSKGWGVYALLTGCEYREGTGMLTVSIHPKIRPHFLWFKDNILQYTKYNLLEYMMLPSMYSQRIFELLKSWDDKPEFLVPIDDFHEMLSTPKTHRENFKEFRKRVLEKAHKDIHEHTSLRYTWTAIKDGRHIGAIRFSFTKRRFAESQIEDGRKAQGKAFAKSQKRTAAFLEATTCARDRKGVCTLRDRAKRVCSICDECDMLREFADGPKPRETQMNQ